MRARFLVVFVPLLGAAPVGATGPGVAGLFLEALAWADDGSYREALDALSRVAEAVPDDPYVELERSEILLRLGRLEEAAAGAARARELDRDNDDALRLLGRIELLRSDRDEHAAEVAREAFERLRELDPEDLEALVSLGQIYLAADRPGLAADALAEASRLRPGHPGIESLLSRALESGADAERVERVQRERLRRDPDSLVTRLELADLLARESRPRESVEVLRGAPAEQRESFDVRRRLAFQLFLSGDVEEALEAARRVHEQWPGYAPGRLLLARIEAAYGRFEDASEILEPLVGGGSMPEAVAEVRVRILEGQGRIAEAAEVLTADHARLVEAERRVEADNLALDLARLWSRHGEWEEALPWAAEAGESQLAEISSPGRVIRARMLARLGRYSEALDALGPPDPRRATFAAHRVGVLLDAGREADAERETELLLEERPDADLRLAEVLSERERHEAAIPLLESAVARDPDSIEALFRLGAAYERSGRIEESVVRFRDLLERAPGFAPALNYLGYLWIDRRENLEEALALVESAVREDPDNGAYVDSLGWGYYRLGRYEEAVAALERAARLLPDDATVLEHLGDALAAIGNREGAIDAYRRAAAHATGTEGSEAAGKLERLRGDL